MRREIGRGGVVQTQDGARQGVAVGVQPVRRQADERVAGADAATVDLAPLAHDADDRAREVEVAVAVEAGHVGGLAAQQRQPAVGAGGGDAADDGDLLVLAQAVAGQVVEEEQRAGAGGEDVVDAVVDDVPADAVEPPQPSRHEHLGADPVGRGDEHGVVEGGEVEEAAEHADAAQDFGPRGGAGERAVAGDQAVVGGDVDAGGGVAGRRGGGLAGAQPDQPPDPSSVRGATRAKLGGALCTVVVATRWGESPSIMLGRSRASLSISSCTGTG